ncbi:hypothetical protein ABZY09_49120 [Streptomyces sp. NPDC002928]|uniref:hypothetical protein n=1 Tax=Streptomyces sp. NPDC002928 TaxID=3154440 RepID=UPI0033BDB424
MSSNDQAFNAQYAQARATLSAQLAAAVAIGVLLLVALGARERRRAWGRLLQTSGAPWSRTPYAGTPTR